MLTAQRAYEAAARVMTTRRLDARHPDQPDRAGALMTINRVTQNMMSQPVPRRPADRARAGSRRSRSSSPPAGSSTGPPTPRPAPPRRCGCAPRVADQQQYARNADDGVRLAEPDRHRPCSRSPTRSAGPASSALQGANTGAIERRQAREALATEVDQIRDGPVGDANTTYLGRPVFGGITAGDKAYDAEHRYAFRRHVGPASVTADGRRRRADPGRRRTGRPRSAPTATRCSTT